LLPIAKRASCPSASSVSRNPAQRWKQRSPRGHRRRYWNPPWRPLQTHRPEVFRQTTGRRNLPRTGQKSAERRRKLLSSTISRPTPLTT